jgi:N-methylhydantoinase A/oxoprolinase/acetone carboxylase beta subunit
MVHDTLDRALASDTASEYDGRFVVPMAGNTSGLTTREETVLARITQAMPLASAMKTRLEVAALERLVARGLVMISGVTPSDASHVLGRLDGWDGAASQKAIRLLGRRRNGAGERFSNDPQAFAQSIIDQLTVQTVDCLLEAAFDEDSVFDGIDPTTLAKHPLTKAALSQHKGVIQLSARLGVPVIGLGASAPSYYGAVGQRLGCEMILPEHAGVANAIGAVVGQVSQRATGLVTSPSEGRYTVHFADGLKIFDSVEAALDALEQNLSKDAQDRARAAGAEDLRLTVKRDIREAEIEGRKMFIEATISVTAAGRPRVAH